MIAAEPQVSPVPATRFDTGRSRRARLTPSRAAVACLLLYLGIVTTEGALRWILSTVRLEPLLYVRELCPIVGIFLAAMMPGLGRRNFYFMVVCLQLMIAAAIGFIHWTSIPQVVFGIKVFLPLLFGVAVYPAILRNWDFFRRGCTVLLAIAVFGVCVNSVVRYPWIGTEFTVGNVTVEGSRDWTELDGRERHPGFARLSADAAIHIVYLSIIAVSGMRGIIRRVALFALSGWAVYLTTSKAPLAGFIGVLVNFFLLEGLPALRNPAPGSVAKMVKAFASFALRLQILALVLATVILPLNTSGMLGFLERDLRSDSQFHLLSMQDRAVTVWPMAMEHIQKVGGRWLGAGAGGVGAPLEIFGKAELPITCDNAFLYAYGVMGIFLVPYLILFIGFIFTRRLLSPKWSATVGLLALVVCNQSPSTNLFEGIYDCFFVGIIIAHTTYGWRMSTSPRGAMVAQTTGPLPTPANA